MQHETSFGHWLTLRRKTLRLQRAELAARIGCAAVTLRKIEVDERRPSRLLAERLAEQLAIPPHERDTFIRVARGELMVDRLSPPNPDMMELSNLPSPTTTLVGRAQEVEDLRATLARADVRLLTLTGAPGVGKTRLAIEVASNLHDVLADGVFFVDLAPLSDPDLVLVAVAQALHVGLSGKQPLGERLRRYLRTRQVLLVLDNFEHVLPAAPQLTQLLTATPHLKLLVTSRVALEISGEHRFIVLPLAVPLADENRRLGLAATAAQARYAAIDLFVQRARAVAPSFALTDADVPAVSAICRWLDGLPLAIELAAARAALFTPHEILAHLNDRFAFLTSHARDQPERHLTLAYAIDWSYNLLAPTEQLLFRRLAVFVGGCTIEAAQAVCNADSAVGNDVVDGVVALVDSSLLQRQVGYDGRSRFGMLETVREYALSRLAASGEEGTMRRQHATYYLALAEAAEQEWDRPGEWAWLRRLVSVRDNLRTALRWALDTRDAALALRLNAALFSFWTLCSALTEARGWIDAALALPHPADTPEFVALEAKVLIVAGFVAAGCGEHAPAYTLFERGLALYRALGDNRGIAWALRSCAFIHMMHEEFAEAGRRYNESLRICQASGDARGLAWSRYALAFLLLARGDLAEARRALEAALVQLRQQDMPFGVFRALLALGYILFEQSDVVGAEARLSEGLALSREWPLLTLITIGLDGLAMVAVAQGRPLRAASLWGTTEALREATGEQRWPIFQHSYDRMLAAGRMQVHEADWAAAWAAGRALTAVQVVAEALEKAETAVSSADRSLRVDRGPR